MRMLRWCSALFLLPCSAALSQGSAEWRTVVVPGTLVQATLSESLSVVARVTAVHGDTLYLNEELSAGAGDSRTVTLRTVAVPKLLQLRRAIETRPSRRATIGKAAAIGAVLLGIFGAATYEPCEQSNPNSIVALCLGPSSASEAAITGAVGGTLLGGLIGALITPKPAVLRWEVVPVPAVP